MAEFLNTLKALTGALLAALVIASAAVAQDNQRNVLVVLDGSNSMWGQIEGRAKIDIARETLQSVLSETTPDMTLGMISYGHRRAKDCTDIEMMVTPASASEAVPRMIEAAQSIVPRGKTPLSDAVRMGADALGFQEHDATVVLITDGIETCEADPCALGNELERMGINLTVHVVGFGLSEDEGRQVACLADTTGGQYFQADNAEDLVDALTQTLAVDDSDFEDEPLATETEKASAREVQFIFRDTPDGVVLNTRDLSSFQIKPIDEADSAEDLEVGYSRDITATARMTPGEYDLLITRQGDNTSYDATIKVSIEAGQGPLVIERVIGARLRIETYLSSTEKIEAGTAVPGAVSGTGEALYSVYRVENGAIVEEGAYGGKRGFDKPVPPGTYLVRGTFGRMVTREKLVTVEAGEEAVLAFNFALSRIYVDARDANGEPVSRQTTYFHDNLDGSHWVKGGGGVDKTGDRLPFFLPQGVWRINAGREGGGKTRGQTLVAVPGEGETITVIVQPGEALPEEATRIFNSPGYRGCIERLGVGHKEGCLVERPDL